MTAIPAVLFVIGAVMAVVFEIVHAWLDRRWITPISKQWWALIYWSSFLIVGFTCQMVPWDRIEILQWIPFGFVMAVHCLLALFGGSFHRKPRP